MLYISNDSPENIYYYPFGTVDFKINASSATVKIYFHSSKNLNNFEYRKTDANGYITKYTNAVFGQEMINGTLVKTVTLNLIDGGIGDSDGIVNGVISDPGGIAILVTDSNIPIWDWRYKSLMILLFLFLLKQKNIIKIFN